MNKSEHVVCQFINELQTNVAQKVAFRKLISKMSNFSSQKINLITQSMVQSTNMILPTLESVDPDRKLQNIKTDTLAISCLKSLKKQGKIEKNYTKDTLIQNKISKDRLQQYRGRSVQPIQDLHVPEYQVVDQQKLAPIMTRFYHIRKLKTEFDQKIQQNRLQNQRRKRPKICNSKRISFDFDGSILSSKSCNLDNQFPHITQSQTLKESKVHRHKMIDHSPLKSQVVHVSSEQSRNSSILSYKNSMNCTQHRHFNNQGNRQTSHIPFIQVSNNVKIIQNKNSQSSGQISLKQSLSFQFKPTSQFKHFSQSKYVLSPIKIVPFFDKDSVKIQKPLQTSEKNQQSKKVISRLKMSKKTKKFLHKFQSHKESESQIKLQRKVTEGPNSLHFGYLKPFYRYQYQSQKYFK